MEGGYQILNLGRINITSTAKKVPGAYDYIEKNLQHKVVLLEGLKLDSKLYDSIFTTFAKSYGNYIGTFTIDAKLYSVVISADDLVHTKRLIPVGDDTIELVESMIADPWESDEVYIQGNRVTRKHSLYELTADTSTGDQPESNPGKWKKVTVGSGGQAEWTEIGTVTGSTSITIPSGYHDFLVQTVYGTVSIIHTLCVNMMTSTEQESVLGTYASSSYNKESSIRFASDHIRLASFLNRGSDVTGQCTVTVYAK